MRSAEKENSNPAEQYAGPSWTIEFWEDANGRSPFERWYLRLDEYSQAVVDAVLKHVVEPLGMDTCKTDLVVLSEQCCQERPTYPVPAMTILHRHTLARRRRSVGVDSSVSASETTALRIT